MPNSIVKIVFTWLATFGIALSTASAMASHPAWPQCTGSVSIAGRESILPQTPMEILETDFTSALGLVNPSKNELGQSQGMIGRMMGALRKRATNAAGRAALSAYQGTLTQPTSDGHRTAAIELGRYLNGLGVPNRTLKIEEASGDSFGVQIDPTNSGAHWLTKLANFLSVQGHPMHLHVMTDIPLEGGHNWISLKDDKGLGRSLALSFEVAFQVSASIQVEHEIGHALLAQWRATGRESWPFHVFLGGAPANETIKQYLWNGGFFALEEALMWAHTARHSSRAVQSGDLSRFPSVTRVGGLDRAKDYAMEALRASVDFVEFTGEAYSEALSLPALNLQPCARWTEMNCVELGRGLFIGLPRAADARQELIIGLSKVEGLRRFMLADPEFRPLLRRR